VPFGGWGLRLFFCLLGGLGGGCAVAGWPLLVLLVVY
jgi:hypothetical protein